MIIKSLNFHFWIAFRITKASTALDLPNLANSLICMLIILFVLRNFKTFWLGLDQGFSEKKENENEKDR